MGQSVPLQTSTSTLYHQSSENTYGHPPLARVLHAREYVFSPNHVFEQVRFDDRVITRFQPGKNGSYDVHRGRPVIEAAHQVSVSETGHFRVTSGLDCELPQRFDFGIFGYEFVGVLTAFPKELVVIQVFEEADTDWD